MRPSIISLALILLGGSALTASAAETPIVCRSPGGTISIEFSLTGKGGSAPSYRVQTKGRDIIGWSRLGVELAGGELLGGSCDVTGVDSHPVGDEFVQFPGKRRQVVGHASECVISLRERDKLNRHWQVVLRAYDDGVAFRYELPKQEGWSSAAIAGERIEFHLPENAVGRLQLLNSFTTSYEKLYETKLLREIHEKSLIGLPLLVDCPGSGWLAISEANLTNHAGMYLAPATGCKPVLESRLSPIPNEPTVAVKASLPHIAPWRVVLLAEDAGKLIESDTILCLNAPCALKDTSWIKPGKTAFPWWNGFFDEKREFKPGLHTATMKHYIDFCAEAGIPYHSLDGIDNTGWYGCQIGPHIPADPTKAVSGIDLPEVLRYAKEKGVRIRLWIHWRDVKAHMARAFPLYREWGIEGVMLDFMDRDDQEMVNFLREVLVLAADNQLTVTLHGMSKPTGLERTFPNLLNSEGVLNLEYNKWDKIGCPPDHQVTVAFARMLAGPLDFHQGSFRGVPVEKFTPQDKAPLVMGTATRTLASYVVYQNHLPMVADYPSAYRDHPGLPMLAKIPCTWDDTRFLAGEVGEYVVLARRSGEDWYIGAMNGLDARDIEVPLRFLGSGRYRAEIFADDLPKKTPHGLNMQSTELTASDTLRFHLDAAGGYMTRLSH